MQGPSLDSDDVGIIPRAVHQLFEGIASADPNVELVIKVSYVESYMERIRDLLDPTHVRDNLQVRLARATIARRARARARRRPRDARPRCR